MKMFWNFVPLLAMALSVLSEKFDSSVITNKFTDPQTENEMKMSILALNVAKGIDNHENRISQNERKIEEMQKMIDKLQSMIDGSTESESEAEEDFDLTKLNSTLGLLITGGAPERSLRGNQGLARKNELYIPATNCSCSFEDWPDKEDGLWAAHTSGGKGFMSCGGMNLEERKVTTCINYVNGKWEYQNLLTEPRIYHTTWNRNGELWMFGGYSNSVWRGDKVSWGSKSRKFATLQHMTESACAIPDERNDQVYITGGDRENLVSIYTTVSYKGYLDAQMNIARSEHGCAGYYKNDKLVLVVAGGRGYNCFDNEYCDDNGWTSSTEMYQIGDPAWRQVAKLDGMLKKPSAVTLDNTIFMTGGSGPRDSWNMKEIMVFHNEEWVKVSEMMYQREYHDAAVIELNGELTKYCDAECKV